MCVLSNFAERRLKVYQAKQHDHLLIAAPRCFYKFLGSDDLASYGFYYLPVPV